MSAPLGGVIVAFWKNNDSAGQDEGRKESSKINR